MFRATFQGVTSLTVSECCDQLRTVMVTGPVSVIDWLVGDQGAAGPGEAKFIGRLEEGRFECVSWPHREPTPEIRGRFEAGPSGTVIHVQVSMLGGDPGLLRFVVVALVVALLALALVGGRALIASGVMAAAMVASLWFSRLNYDAEVERLPLLFRRLFSTTVARIDA